MCYQTIKIIHIISSAVLFGGGIATACYCLFINRSKKAEVIAPVIAQILRVGLVLVIGSGVIQLMSGLLLVYLNAIFFIPVWLIASAMLYFIAVMCWIISVYMLIRCYQLAMDSGVARSSLPDDYGWYYKIWRILLIPAVIASLSVLYLMIIH